MDNVKNIQGIIRDEEILFNKRLKTELKIFDRITKSLKENDVLNGSLVANLYQTYGFPLVELMAFKKKICYRL
jgi:Alanyl-tRNA synthetase